MTFGAQSQEVQAINGEVARLQSSVSQRREKIMRHSVQMEKLSERMFGTPQEEAPKHTAQGGVKS